MMLTKPQVRALAVLFGLATTAIKLQGKFSFFSGRDKGKEALVKVERQLENVHDVSLATNRSYDGTLHDLSLMCALFEMDYGQGDWAEELYFITEILRYKEKQMQEAQG